jgi:glycosyltransferase involved in cell wall biosynthesis
MAEIPEAHFVFLNKLDAAAMYEGYRKCSLVVMTPRSDGTPVSALEAMALRKPLILPPLDYDQEVFAEGILHLQDWEATTLANAMTNVLSGLLVLDTAAAYQRVCQFADRENELARLEAIAYLPFKK